MKNKLLCLLIILSAAYASAETFTQKQIDEAMALRVATIEFNLKLYPDVIIEKVAAKLNIDWKGSNAVTEVEAYMNKSYANALKVEQLMSEIGRTKE